jgi:hypothetical protein
MPHDSAEDDAYEDDSDHDEAQPIIIPASSGEIQRIILETQRNNLEIDQDDTARTLDSIKSQQRGPSRLVLLIFTLLVALVVAMVLIFSPSQSSSNTCPATDSQDNATNQELNPPIWPDNVILITSDMTAEAIKRAVQPTQDSPHDWNDFDHASSENPKGPLKPGFDSERHFVQDRFAILFAPGTYKGVNVEVGYYVQLLGLGSKAEDVVFTDCEFGPYVPALNKHKNVGGRPGLSLDTFWRAAENYKTKADQGQLWAVSQAAPIRRVHVAKSASKSLSQAGSGRASGNLYLHDNGAQASGGHMANAIVEGFVDFGSQQQWCSRSVDMKEPPQNGAWSLVFVDCIGAVPADGPDVKNPSVTVHNPTITVEKPFIAVDNADGKYKLRIPVPRKRQKGNSAWGPDLTGTNDTIRDFSAVRVALANKTDVDGNSVPDLCVAQKINDALEMGKDVVLSPGIYYLSEPIRIVRNDQVLLRIGLATLVAPKDGTPCVQVLANLQGVRLAGFMLEASVIPKKQDRNFVASLLEWGEEKGQQSNQDDEDVGSPSNPGVLTDIFARVGGSNLNRQVSTDVMIRIHSSNVMGDNLWLWRADHVQLRSGEEPNFPPLDYHQVTLDQCICETGIEVNGNDVSIHGLAVEHTTKNQTIWNGDRGTVIFYQCELPYDATPAFGRQGFVGYRVGEQVTSHVAEGVGIYSNFRDHAVPVRTAITHPKKSGIHFNNAFTVLLNNHGLIESVINGEKRSYDGKPNWD